MLAGTGAGSSHVVATDIKQASATNQCKLIRVEHPDGSEYVVGTCDEDGNIAVQPRASRDTSQRHVYNVLAYGARPDGVNIRDGQATMASLTFTTSVSTPFTADDVGRTIVILGALDTGDLVTTIAAYTDPATITLAAAPERTLLTATLHGRPGSEQPRANAVRRIPPRHLPGASPTSRENQPPSNRVERAELLVDT